MKDCQRCTADSCLAKIALSRLQQRFQFLSVVYMTRCQCFHASCCSQKDHLGLTWFNGAAGWFAFRSDAKAILGGLIMSSWLNVLLVMAPLGIIAHYANWSPYAVFIMNFAALIPLALLLGEVTEDLAVRFGATIGGLLNATFGNVVELILSIAALSKGLYVVIAASLIGSILSNLLLVLGKARPPKAIRLSQVVCCGIAEQIVTCGCAAVVHLLYVMAMMHCNGVHEYQFSECGLVSHVDDGFAAADEACSSRACFLFD